MRRKVSKKDTILKLLARPKGASIAELEKATKWQAHRPKPCSYHRPAERFGEGQRHRGLAKWQPPQHGGGDPVQDNDAGWSSR